MRALFVLPRELVLLVTRVEPGEGVLPAPDDERAGNRRDAESDERGAENPTSPPHARRNTPAARTYSPAFVTTEQDFLQVQNKNDVI